MYVVVTLALSSLIFTSCNKGGSYCTSILKMVSAKVETAGNKVTFDEVYTIRKSTGEKIVYSQNINSPSNVLVVLDDSYMPKFKNKTDKFIFYGFNQGQKLFEEEYEISSDNCHINKRSGKEVINY